MKKIAYILMVIILFKPGFPILDYIINYDFIATELCENTSTPELGCNGKCHLKSELANEAKKDTTDSNKKKYTTLSLEILFFQNSIQNGLRTIRQLNKKVLNQYNCIYFRINITSIFHPPILV
ncbi:hypothetical protein LXD69_15745 [Flavobacterium sediminilitoris]|uniref:Uncharacterized protein n=1 Tax=Flavobacterium sediminilitoris TaxID=2024526 RepID=A0ABY4HLL7_9FLAO|nr:MULTISPECIES: hypothetical protein [Flavobacterium]UOX33473.1 hypothetical protein LXD69_15745 [Flavobacterium sediminilitoris]